MIGIVVWIVVVPAVIAPAVVIPGVIVPIITPARPPVPGVIKPDITVGIIPGIVIPEVAPAVPIVTVIGVVITIVVKWAHPPSIPIHVVDINIGSVLNVDIEVFAVCNVGGKIGVVKAPDTFRIGVRVLFCIEGVGHI